MNLKDYIVDVPNFPKKGIIFKDITPLLNNSAAFRYAVDQMAQFVKQCGANVVVAPEARGFLFASAVAYAANTRFVLIRKPHKLPRAVHTIKYALEYGTNQLEMHQDDLHANDKVVIIDDVLATGGTAEAIIELLHQQHAIVAGISFLIDLPSLHDSNIFANYQLQKVVTY